MMIMIIMDKTHIITEFEATAEGHITTTTIHDELWDDLNRNPKDFYDYTSFAFPCGLLNL